MRSRLLILLMPIVGLFGQPSFNANDISTSADGANDVYAVDIDGDGDIDVLSSYNNAGGVVAWYENNGSQSFTAHTLPTNNGTEVPNSVYAIDMDKDGDVDVVSGTSSYGRVLWFENDGSGNFTTKEVTTKYQLKSHCLEFSLKEQQTCL